MRFRPVRTSLSVTALSYFAFSSLAFAFQTAGPIDLAATPRPAPSAFEPEAPAAHLRIDTSLVQIPVQVSTDLGAPITGLSRESFRIFEDGVEQKITHFSQDDAPISIGVVFDSSGSMRNKMHKSLEAASALFKTANPEDEFFWSISMSEPNSQLGSRPIQARCIAVSVIPGPSDARLCSMRSSLPSAR